jgi:hypothetical protein
MNNKNNWIAAYYPLDIIEDQRVKTFFCLLFDKVVCHFPIADMACGGGSGISSEFSDDPLVDEGILDFREEFLLDEIEGDFSPGHFWGTDEEFRKYHDLNVAGMALICSENEGAVPATHRADTPIPISVLSSLDVNRAANIQATALAIQSLELTLPEFATLNSYEILEAREKLKDQLQPFRSAMFSLAPKVRAGIAANASIPEVFKEAKYIVETDVIPRLDELKNRLKLEKSSFWRKLVYKISGQLPGIALKWISGAQAIAAIDSAKLLGGIAGQAVDNERLASQLLSNGGLGYLIQCQEIVTKKINR